MRLLYVLFSSHGLSRSSWNGITTLTWILPGYTPPWAPQETP